jgi:hypothetical protein
MTASLIMVIRHADRQRADPRRFQMDSAFIRHLHDVARKVRLTNSELQTIA